MFKASSLKAIARRILGFSKKQAVKKIFIQLADGTLFHQHSLEIEIVDHCNLTCGGCNHLSPAIPRRFESAERILGDLSTLKQHMRVECVKLLGGEPLLHPDIEAIVAAVRKSNISNKIILLTNGTLLSRITDGLLEILDGVEISQYPSMQNSAEEIALLQKRAEKYSVTISSFYFRTFHKSFAFKGTEDKKLVQRIFNTCRKVHLWGCYAVYEGYLFKCPQSIYLAKVIPELQHDPHGDGLSIHSCGDFSKKIIPFLTSRTPLNACTFCVGNVGHIKDHHMTQRDVWKSQYEVSTESVVDHDLLKKAEADIAIRVGCRNGVPFES